MGVDRLINEIVPPKGPPQGPHESESDPPSEDQQKWEAIAEELTRKLAFCMQATPVTDHVGLRHLTESLQQCFWLEHYAKLADFMIDDAKGNIIDLS